jgi:leucyl-tRNA synthetase
MFVAPPEKEIEWTDAGLEGSFRFLARVWRLVDQLIPALAAGAVPPPGAVALGEDERALRRKTHDTIRRVTGDLYPRVHLNTAISAVMELVNELYLFCDRAEALAPGRRETAAASLRPATAAVLREAIEALVVMLSPFTPHLVEELWERLGHAGGVVAAGWPAFDPDVAKADEVVVPVQVNGKLRSRLTVPADATEEQLRTLALADPAVQSHTQGRRVVKVVIAKGKLVNVVVAP